MNDRTNRKEILIIAGEASGDTHGAGLVRALKNMRPDLHFFGIGGDQMVAEGVETIHHAREMSFLGFFEIIKHLPFVRRVLRRMITLLEKRNPCLVLLIDYPGFNLRLARAANKRGIPVLYYISPQVWAWDKKRVNKMAEWVGRIVVIFPFEEAIYQKVGMDVRFVGHPLKDVVKPRLSKGAFFEELGFDPNRPTVGLLPGSRLQEVRKLLPEMVRACDFLRQEIPDLQAVVGIAPTLPDEAYGPVLDGKNRIFPVHDRTHDVMAHSDVAIVASGTATLETTILGTPLVVVYKMSRLSFLLGKALVKVDHIGLVNIVAGRKIVPELLQDEANGRRIADEVINLIADENRRDGIKRDLEEVSQKLGEKGATKRAAEAVLDFIHRITPST